MIFDIAGKLFSSIGNAKNYQKSNHFKKQKNPSESWSSIVIPEPHDVIKSSIEAFYTFMRPYEAQEGPVIYTSIKKPSRPPSDYFTFQYFFQKR